MHIFYQPNIKGNEVILNPAESLHCIKVLRSKVGGKVTLVDGAGGYYIGEIANEDAKACKVSILSSIKDYQPLPYSLHIAMAPTKNIDRFEWFVEKATEIGLSSITPILCERSERRKLRMDRIEKILVSAMKQSEKAYLPTLNALTDINDFLSSSTKGTRLIAHCMEGDKAEIWKTQLSDDITLLIGPEGDFSPQELEMAENIGFMPVSLGSYRLRTETAGVQACSAVYFNKMQ